jgi:meso-butanediol dehydrogenase/(S,S)-butanediol dehydrogenase/diacetyl reductase
MFPKFTKAPDDPTVVEAARKGAHQDVPMGRLVLPLEVAYAGLFLASDEASIITGVALPVDGGRSAF